MPEERDDQIRQRPPGVRKPVIKIQNYVRRHTNPVDIETLHSKGFKKVNLITLSKINKLIAYAVERTFEKYSDSLGGVGAKKIEAEVESVVRRRLQELQNPQSAQQPDEIEAAEPEAPEHGDAAARPPAPPQASPEPADTPSSPSRAATEGPPQDPADGPAQAIQTTHPAATAADTASEAVREQAPAPPPRGTAAARPAAPPASPPASLRGCGTAPETSQRTFSTSSNLESAP